MLLLLLACGSTYLLLGNVQEAIILLVFVVVVTTITLYQERKTERALEALRDLSSPRALVVRGGARRRIAGREVVPGDILVLSEGDRVPADGILLSARESGDRRVAADRRIRAGSKARGARRHDDGAAGRRRSAVRVLGDAGRSRRRACAGDSHRRPHRARQDRKIAARGRTGTDAAAARHTPHGAGAGSGGPGAVRFARRRVWPDPRRVVARVPRRPDPWPWPSCPRNCPSS